MSHGQHHQLKLAFSQRSVLCYYVEDEVFGWGVFFNYRDTTSGQFYSQFVSDLLIIVIIALAESPDVHVEDMDINLGISLLDQCSFLESIHAAGRGAVVSLDIPGAYALEEGY